MRGLHVGKSPLSTRLLTFSLAAEQLIQGWDRLHAHFQIFPKRNHVSKGPFSALHTWAWEGSFMKKVCDLHTLTGKHRLRVPAAG